MTFVRIVIQSEQMHTAGKLTRSHILSTFGHVVLSNLVLLLLTHARLKQFSIGLDQSSKVF